MKIFKIERMIILALILLAGCSVRPVETELAVTHPAHPQAASAPFTPPVNVFQSDASLVRKPPATDAPMTHKQHGDSEGKHMNHQEQPKKMEKQSSEMPDMKKTESEHKEHSQ